jgi:SAM-dependent methyltransferase
VIGQAETAVPAVVVNRAGRSTRTAAALTYRRAREAHRDAIARRTRTRAGWNRAYRARLQEIFRLLVPPGQRVLEIGCGGGELLAALEPELGVGIDISSDMIRCARRRFPGLKFVRGDAHALPLQGPFDVIILSDVINDLWDVQTAFDEIATLSHSRTRIVINTYSRLWEVLLTGVRRTGLANPVLEQNWLTVEDVTNLFNLAGLERLRDWSEVLCPVGIPLIGTLANRFVVKVWPFNALGLTNVIVARPRKRPSEMAEPVVSVVIPARNEAGNITGIFDRTPEMGRGTELLFVEGHSTDGTCAAIEAAMREHPTRRCRLLRQTGTGKGDAVRLGFSEASGDVLMILDADLTVAPEDLPRFLEPVMSGEADFVNGTRLVYPMEDEAMHFFNLIGNKFFGLAFSWLLGQPIKDTLCGTKVLRKTDYARIDANRSYFGDFDPFGDFDLLFGAAKLGLKIVDMPIRYRARTYGTTNIQRWRHGALLFRMLGFAARRLKFV